MKRARTPLAIFSSFVLLIDSSLGQETSTLSQGQKIYAPAYSHIYSGDKESPFLLTVTLSIRNIDPNHPMTVTAVDYYDTKGKLLKKHATAPVVLAPLESIRFVVPETDKTGGSGANFIVDWTSNHSMNPPVVETIMIGAKSQQGISFTSRGQVIMPSE